MDLHYFFRVVEDSQGPRVPLFIVMVFIGGLLLLVRYFNFAKLYACIGLLLQLTILCWYFKAGRLLSEGLPLYHCRIMLWLLSLGLLLEVRSRLIVWVSILGITFSLPVLLIRDMDAYAFPHITGFYYFLGHGMIFLMAISYLRRFYVHLRIENIMMYSIGCNLFIQLFNELLGANYGYLQTLPLLGNDVSNHYAFVIVSLVIILLSIVVNHLLYLNRNYLQFPLLEAKFPAT
ncbi:TMEM164 family acyltransferase [Hutsoniella sourekii]